MKLNKLLSFITFGATMLSLASCTDSVDYDAAQPVITPGVYFSSEEETEFVIDANAEAQVMTIYRNETDGALTVPLQVNGDTEFFTIPASVDFPDGQSSTTFSIIPNVAEMVDFSTYYVTISVPDELTSPYIINSWEGYFTYANGVEWVSLGECEYTSDFTSAYYNGADPVTYPVEIQEHANTPGLYRLVNPYGEAYPLNEPGDYDPDAECYMVINATDPTRVYIETSPTTMDWGYGIFTMSSAAYLNLQNGISADRIAENGLFGKLDNGMITFPARSLIISMSKYQGGAWSNANPNGAFCVDLTVLE